MTDPESLALDLLSVCREVASNPANLNRLLKDLFSGHGDESEFLGLLRAITRLRFLERAILDALAAIPGKGPIEAADLYKDVSKSVIMAALVHSEESAARLRSYYPHILTDSDIERVRLTVKTGMSREDISKAAQYLSEIQKRVASSLDS
jgi:hypothetical protein